MEKVFWGSDKPSKLNAHSQTWTLSILSKAITVQEGDNILITRLKSPWNLEFRREFTKEGMVQVSIVASSPTNPK